MRVPAAFADMPRWRWDEAGRRWLGHLPAVVDERCAAWALTVDGPAGHGSNALVVPVRRGGEALALRLEPPGDEVTAHAAALRFWRGRGTVRLLDDDPGAGALLLERLDGSRSLEREPLGAAIEVLGGITRALAVPSPSSARSTAAVAAQALETFERDWTALGRPAERGLLTAALGAAERRAAAPAGDAAVDGDLHFGQVLAADRAPWLVVDPVLLRGDREYDLGRVLWSRIDELPDGPALGDAFGRFTRAAEVPEDRARDWVLVRAMSYLLWGLQRGLTIDPPRCVRLLRRFA